MVLGRMGESYGRRHSPACVDMQASHSGLLECCTLAVHMCINSCYLCREDGIVLGRTAVIGHDAAIGHGTFIGDDAQVSMHL